MLSSELESPLANRKRQRQDEEETVVEEMELDLQTMSDLNLEELKIAQQIAQEKIKSSLFLDIAIPKEPIGKNPFQDDINMELKPKMLFNFEKSPQKSLKCTLTQYHPTTELLQYVCELILKNGNAKLSFFTNTSMTPRALEIQEMFFNEDLDSNVTDKDTSDLLKILINILPKFPALLPEELHVACQGILALNQATGLTRKSGTSIKTPTTLTKNLIRQLLEFIVSFCCQLCQDESQRTRNQWAQQLSTIFSQLIHKSNDNWRFLFFELLLHCHGLYDSSLSIIWGIDDQFKKEISLRYNVMRTPSRKRVNLTPLRKSRDIIGMSGKALKRNLFKPITNQSPSFVHTMDGKEFVKSPSVDSSLDREKYSKRLRLK
ncbi:hypothetical protein HK103_007684 [Boothiomyces macroporosus]|uniref:Uncharacterized protein n=1 Tax=Boothiomyces macroporosus TaxID=261099 RepID=A0AAD5Y195_9FUNG|nr:hypothetical protein HK103_007684 [Boothiomyces macroporosus]